MTTRAPHQLKPYEESAYDICDIVETIAQHRGDLAANVYVQHLVGQVVKDHPKAAESALGKTKAIVCLATYKATQDMVNSGEDTDASEWPAELIDAIDAAFADYGEDRVIEAVTAALDALEQTTPRVGPVPSSGEGSKAVQKAAQPFDLAAAVRGELGRPDMRLR